MKRGAQFVVREGKREQRDWIGCERDHTDHVRRSPLQLAAVAENELLRDTLHRVEPRPFATVIYNVPAAHAARTVEHDLNSDAAGDLTFDARPPERDCDRDNQ